MPQSVPWNCVVLSSLVLYDIALNCKEPCMVVFLVLYRTVSYGMVSRSRVVSLLLRPEIVSSSASTFNSARDLGHYPKGPEERRSRRKHRGSRLGILFVGLCDFVKVGGQTVSQAVSDAEAKCF